MATHFMRNESNTWQRIINSYHQHNPTSVDWAPGATRFRLIVASWLVPIGRPGRRDTTNNFAPTKSFSCVSRGNKAQIDDSFSSFISLTHPDERLSSFVPGRGLPVRRRRWWQKLQIPVLINNLVGNKRAWAVPHDCRQRGTGEICRAPSTRESQRTQLAPLLLRLWLDRNKLLVRQHEHVPFYVRPVGPRKTSCAA